ncbi:hypothetical protein GYA54_02010 [Candidatus Kuenenbacteria bacterium]|nr:hypothetical protein [Candidatus Kuenenbacteria bacterium]
MKKKVLIFGLDGNVLNNYSLKARCAGQSLSTNAGHFFNIKKSIGYFAQLYLESSGQNSLDQFRLAYQQIARPELITNKILIKTEKDYRANLFKIENKFKIFIDVKKFLEKNKNKYYFTITTAVPVGDIARLDKKLRLSKYFTLICARGGALYQGRLIKISNFDKGKKHFDYILKTFKATKNKIIAVSSARKDITNALDHGIISVALPKIFSRKSLLQLKPTIILKDCRSLTRFLDAPIRKMIK